MRIPFLFKLIFNRHFFEKIAAIGLVVFLIYLLESFLFIFLVTFLFAYLFLDLSKWIGKRLTKIVKSMESGWLKSALIWMNRLPIIVTIIYVAFVIIIGTLFYNLIPQIIEETKGLIKEWPQIIGQLQGVAGALQAQVSFDLGLDEAISSIVNKASLETTLNSIFENAKSIGVLLTKIGIALILSYVFIIDRGKIEWYFLQMKGGNFGFLYDQFSIIFSKISKGFGLIFKAQAIIAFVNAILTVIGLLVISFFHGGDTFPFIAMIGLIVFIMGFIPVLGFLLSTIPILLVGFNYGGGPVIVGILVMIAVVHVVEAYYLNPKIVSSYMEFPIFISFTILLISEHFFGFIGLLIGIPIFYILLDSIKDFDVFISKIKRISSTIDTEKTNTKEAIHKNIRLSRSGKRASE